MIACFFNRVLISGFLIQSIVAVNSVMGQARSSPELPKESTEMNLAGISQKVRELTLDGMRPRAIALIKERHTKFPKERSQLLLLWREVTTVFVRESTQAQYSLAESIWLDRPSEAVSVLRPLLEVERGQMHLYRLLAKAASRDGDCAALEQVLGLVKVDAIEEEESSRFSALLADCKGADERVSLVKGSRTSALYYDLELRRLERQPQKALDKGLMRRTAEHFKKEHPLHPEARYWIWKTSPSEKKDVSSARDYREKCNSKTNRFRMEFGDTPFLCSRVKEVDLGIKADGGLGV